jgi:hypothetical protein
MRKSLAVCVYVNLTVIIGLCLYVFIVPAALLISDLRDPALTGEGIPRCAFRWHRVLSPKYARWAKARVASGAAGELSTADISGTEWPLFGSVFYLWATEALQDAYAEDPTVGRSVPKDYAREAIAAAAALVADPNHAGWVRQHWGDRYLEEENLFYRMLLISALTSYQKLSGDKRYEPLLRSQAESLATELDASPYGLLDDYPGQCYPVDIVPAIAAIRRADTVLGTDHTEFAARAIRGFQDTRLDTNTGLPAYVVTSRNGIARDSARGVGLSFMLIWAPEIWPETARQWYRKYCDRFWQEGRWFAGFREFPHDIDVGWLNMTDVDAGPVVFGYGTAASAFGVGAVRAMGDRVRAGQLGAEGLVAAWPLPDGTLLVPRLLSNFSDAPYLGEVATLFALTRRAVLGARGTGPASLPGIVYLGVGGLLLLGFGEITLSLWCLRNHRRHASRYTFPSPRFQFGLWVVLLVGVVPVWVLWHPTVGLVLLLSGQLVPFRRRCSGTGAEERATEIDAADA